MRINWTAKDKFPITSLRCCHAWNLRRQNSLSGEITLEVTNSPKKFHHFLGSVEIFDSFDIPITQSIPSWLKKAFRNFTIQLWPKYSIGSAYNSLLCSSQPVYNAMTQVLQNLGGGRWPGNVLGVTHGGFKVFRPKEEWRTCLWEVLRSHTKSKAKWSSKHSLHPKVRPEILR